MVQTGNGNVRKPKVTDCDQCAYYQYDEDDGSYSCSAEMDEDEAYRFMTTRSSACPFFRGGDEYSVVRHQL
ncbi:MAG: DUF6472 family protein [Lachnospiraceae bacterium]|jgi:hypothetical protein|nr:DUF6472 family protein [Lachnospiraceae bacterium]